MEQRGGKKKDKFRKDITSLKKSQTEGHSEETGGGEKSKKAALVGQQVHVLCLSLGKQGKQQTFYLRCNRRFDLHNKTTDSLHVTHRQSDLSVKHRVSACSEENTWLPLNTLS